MMKLSLSVGDNSIDFQVTFSRRKTMAIAIDPPGIIKVAAPVGTPEAVIIDRVSSKMDWIIKKLEIFSDPRYHQPLKQYMPGETFFYLGETYSLQVKEQQGAKTAQVELIQGQQVHQGQLVVTVPAKVKAKDDILVQSKGQENNPIREALHKWYLTRAQEIISQRVAYFQPWFTKKPTKIVAKNQQKIWGSCTAKDGLLFNWRLVMAPIPVIDYIVVHEMCHMVHKNHSRTYWRLVTSIMPDYKVRKDWLKNNGMLMDL